MKTNKKMVISLSVALLMACVAIGSMLFDKNKNNFSDVDVSNLPIYEM